MSVKVTAELQWSATVLDKMVTPEQFPELGEVPSTISAVTQLCRLIEIQDGAKLCIGTSLYRCTTKAHIPYMVIQVCMYAIFMIYYMHIMQ